MTVILSNFGVGGLVGLTGVAGFLLPIVYTGLLQMSVTQGLALSFAAFILSGALGSFNYKKAGNLDVSFGLRLSAGSMAGAVLGVKLNLIIPEEQVKILLYVVVLLSGISILLRKDGKAAETEKKAAAGAAGAKEKGFRLEKHLVPTLLLGFVTGLICALSGAGGPILVMPLLVVFGTGVRVAVGIALFNSIFYRDSGLYRLHEPVRCPGAPACVGCRSGKPWRWRVSGEQKRSAHKSGRFKTGDRSIFYIDCSLEAVPLGGQLFSCLQPPQPVAVPSCASLKSRKYHLQKRRQSIRLQTGS